MINLLFWRNMSGHLRREEAIYMEGQKIRINSKKKSLFAGNNVLFSRVFFLAQTRIFIAGLSFYPRQQSYRSHRIRGEREGVDKSRPFSHIFSRLHFPALTDRGTAAMVSPRDPLHSSRVCATDIQQSTLVNASFTTLRIFGESLAVTARKQRRQQQRGKETDLY